MEKTTLPLRSMCLVIGAIVALAAITLLPVDPAVAAAAPSAAQVSAVSRPDKCAGCHFPPNAYHFGLACHQCHSASRFLPSKVARPAHPVPLVGRHMTVPCEKCHQGVRAPATDCAVCHSAPKQHLVGPCTTCHTPAGWAESARAAGIMGTAAPHLVTAADDCLVCHAPMGPNWPAPPSHSDYASSQCLLCHDSAGQARVAQDHTGLEQLFQGKHTLLSCLQCHTTGQFQGTAPVCVACHREDDRHAGQFGEDCVRCHTPMGWPGATFNHSETGFSLDGGHSGAPCTGCHAGGVFSGTPRECAACHGEPAYHAGLLGAACADCHSVGEWLPASYGRPHAFPTHHKGASSCRTCHPSSLGAYNCFGCHNEAELGHEHEEHDIPNWGTCVDCHPNGGGG